MGAFAGAFYGVPRYTADLDLLVRPTVENGKRLIGALDEFGFGNLGLTLGHFSTADKVIQLGVTPNRIDLLTSISGVTFDEAWSSREVRSGWYRRGVHWKVCAHSQQGGNRQGEGHRRCGRAKETIPQNGLMCARTKWC